MRIKVDTLPEKGWSINLRNDKMMEAQKYR